MLVSSSGFANSLSRHLQLLVFLDLLMSEGTVGKTSAACTEAL